MNAETPRRRGRLLDGFARLVYYLIYATIVICIAILLYMIMVAEFSGHRINGPIPPAPTVQ
jgi:hypothetical protein